MAQGWQSGAKCFETVEQAGSDACSQTFGVTSAGLLSCTGYAVVGDEVELTLSSGTTTPWTPMVCERFDYASTWGPLASAALVGAVVIWGIQELIRYFRTDHEL